MVYIAAMKEHNQKQDVEGIYLAYASLSLFISERSQYKN